ncbi:hypothetical protein TIFTF001_021409 [Ficus carica]|uniref:Uncharacterized protein n=1 Tax=Ficus carica TaxID=3494 RepID=A0AA88DAQ5_FICCA|nr:hypothetical protein TIFTF001_021409 [Ficus carica]
MTVDVLICSDHKVPLPTVPREHESKSTGAAHLLLQHVTSPPVTTYSDRNCPCRCRRQPPYCPLCRVRDAWPQSIGPIAPVSLRPSHPSGALALPLPSFISSTTDLSIRVPTGDTTPVSPLFRRASLLQVINCKATSQSRPDYPTTLGVAAGGIFGINILVLEGGHPPFQ